MAPHPCPRWSAACPIAAADAGRCRGIAVPRICDNAKRDPTRWAPRALLSPDELGRGTAVLTDAIAVPTLADATDDQVAAAVAAREACAYRGEVVAACGCLHRCALSRGPSWRPGVVGPADCLRCQLAGLARPSTVHTGDSGSIPADGEASGSMSTPSSSGVSVSPASGDRTFEARTVSHAS